SYFPEDWASAEADYASLQADRTGSAGAADRYNASADRYREIFQKTLSRYAGGLIDEIQAARARLIAAGIEDTAPEYLDIADRAARDAENLYDAEDYYAARPKALEALDRYRSLGIVLENYHVRKEVIAAGAEQVAPEYLVFADETMTDLDRAFRAENYRSLEAGAQEVLDRYNSLKTGLEAYAVREEVIRRDFAGLDRDNFTRAGKTFLAAMDAYEAGAAKEALDGAGESKIMYEAVLNNGWAAYAGQRRDLARRGRQAALDVKANVAVKDDFSRVDQTYNQAESAYTSKVYHNAVDLYALAEKGFAETVLAAEEKRRIAQAALDAAEEKLVESENTALNAEKILEGGEE
ncbi:MAG: hypothetical protein LBI94_06685, partial [Treponema sp.]|nr:hypothetical protein [Treponema sp.]